MIWKPWSPCTGMECLYCTEVSLLQNICGWDKEVTWKSIPALSLLELERSNDPAVKDSHFAQVKDVERRAVSASVCQCWVQFSCVVRGDRWVSGVLWLTLWRDRQVYRDQDLTEKPGAGQHVVLPRRASFSLLRSSDSFCDSQTFQTWSIFSLQILSLCL